MFEQFKNSAKFFLSLAACITLRLFGFPVPNIEPVMATLLPVSHRLGKYAGFAFAFTAIAAIDILTGKAGLWTIYAAAAYGAVGFLASKYFDSARERAKGKISLKNYIYASVAGTLAFDAITALLFGWQFGQTLAQTIIGQIPFTAYHLVGNIALVAVFSPLLEKLVFGSKTLDKSLESVAARVALPLQSI